MTTKLYHMNYADTATIDCIIRANTEEDAIKKFKEAWRRSAKRPFWTDVELTVSELVFGDGDVAVINI